MLNIKRGKPILAENPVPKELNNYQMLDIIKYAAAIAVIFIHCGQGNEQLSQGFLEYFMKNIVCRIAVPFFFITSAYFVRKGSGKNPTYVSGYLKNTTKSYLLWGLAFAPIGLDWARQNLALAGNLLPLALLYGLIHIGTYYHLWYIPAMLFSLFFVNQLLKRVSYQWLFIISGSLFVFGSAETYYGLLPSGLFKDFFDTLIKIVFTTRSGLFYGMIFVLMGFFICDYQEKWKSLIRYVPTLTILSAVLLIAEGTFLYYVPNLDMNFLLGLIPFSFFFFLWIASLSYRPKRDTKKIRELSKYYYFIHPACIVISEQIGLAYGIRFLSSGFLSFLLIVLLTHLLSICAIGIRKPLPRSRIFLAVLIGMAITFILAGVFLSFQSTTTTLKFEFVPCVWFAASLIMSFFLAKQSGIKP